MQATSTTPNIVDAACSLDEDPSPARSEQTNFAVSLLSLSYGTRFMLIQQRQQGERGLARLKLFILLTWPLVPRLAGTQLVH